MISSSIWVKKKHHSLLAFRFLHIKSVHTVSMHTLQHAEVNVTNEPTSGIRASPIHAHIRHCHIVQSGINRILHLSRPWSSISVYRQTTMSIGGRPCIETAQAVSVTVTAQTCEPSKTAEWRKLQC